MARAIDGDALKRWCEKIIDQACHPATVQIGEVFLDKVRSMPTLTPPNEPLTLEQLRKMDGEPVWVDTIKRWGIVRVCGYGISVLTKSGEYDVTRMKFYRRPPEGEVDA